MHYSTLFFFFFFSFFFLHSISSSSSLSTVAISSNGVCALVPSVNGSRKSPILNCTQGNPVTNISYTSLIAGASFLCGVSFLKNNSSSSVLRCWDTNAGNSTVKRVYRGPVLTELSAGVSHFCGLVGKQRQLRCWRWRNQPALPADVNFSSIATGEDFVCGIESSSKTIRCFGKDKGGVAGNEPSGSFYMLAAGKTHACGLSTNGELVCWGAGATAVMEAPSDIVSLALGENTTCALASNGILKCWGDNAEPPGKLGLTAFVAATAKGKTICGVLEKNYSLICWGTGGGAAPAVEFGRVLPGPCMQSCPCGVLVGSGDLCFTGVICQPCIPVNVTGVIMPPTQTSGGGIGVHRSDHRRALIISGGTGLCFAFVVVTCLLVLQRRRWKIAPSPELLPQRRRRYDIEEFSFQTLSTATENFSDARKIGSGSFGSVYHANLAGGRSAAVKRAQHHAASSYKKRAFRREISLLSRLHHKNLVNLLGFCDAAGELILVYEHCSNGSLADQIYSKSSKISSWKMRLQIALDAARGLQYLHVYAEPRVLHRDIKPSNILLTGTMTAKLADFGLSLECSKHSTSSGFISGTLGYLDPEYYRLQELSDKSDVYSFGVVLLELLTGYKAVHEDELTGELQNVVNVFVPKIQDGDIENVLDKKLPPPSPYEIEAVAAVAYLAVGCVSMDGDDRPSITEVVAGIEMALSALSYGSAKCLGYTDQCAFTEAR